MTADAENQGPAMQFPIEVSKWIGVAVAVVIGIGFLVVAVFS